MVYDLLHLTLSYYQTAKNNLAVIRNIRQILNNQLRTCHFSSMTIRKTSPTFPISYFYIALLTVNNLLNRITTDQSC